MKWFRGKVYDDTGKPVTLYRSLRSADWVHAGIKSPSSGKGRRWPVYVDVLIALGVAGPACVLAVVTGEYMVVLLMAIVPVCFVLVVMSPVAIVSNRMNTGRIRTKCLHESICPSCGYSLAEVPANEANLTVCPECGAAWRLQEILAQ
ncbi:MAG: hypothetical protein H6815_12480 [Phycisphaeraceae bacterium]|nr:hypothetical protein [Phycisphaerales bacterium]MCB9861257.1 hypothetical protein [Phycisphaeraceae bacterium]